MPSLKKNIVFTIVGQVSVVFLGLISFKHIYSNFGEDALGVISFAYILGVIFSSALDMGLSKTTVREISGFSKIEPNYIYRLMRCFSFFYVGVYLLVVGLYFFLAEYIAGSWLVLNEMSFQTAFDILVILGPACFLSIFRVFFSSVLTGIQRLDIVNIIDVLSMLFQQLGITLLMFFGLGLHEVVLWIVVTLVLRVLAYFFACVHFFSFSSIFPVPSHYVINRIKVYASKLFLDSLVLLVHKQLDKLVMSKFLPVGTLGIYSSAYAALSKVSLISYAFSQSAFPAFSELDKSDNKKELNDNFFVLQNILSFLTMPVFFGVVYLGSPVITFLLDRVKAEQLEVPLIFLSCAFYLNGVLRLLRVYCFSTGKPGYIIKSDLVSLLVMAPCTIVLIIEYGILGASFSWLLFYILGVFLIVPSVYKKEFGKEFWSWFKPVLTALLVASLSYSPLFYFFYGASQNLLFSFSIFSFSSFLYFLIVINIVDKCYRDLLFRKYPFIKLVKF